MSSGYERTIVVSTRSLRDYLIDIAVSFQEGVDVVVIKGYGKYISKAVDLYNVLADKMKDSIEQCGVSIGSEVIKGKGRPYIAIKVKKRY